MSKTITRRNEPPELAFELRAPAAQAVYLAGTFNDWSAVATPMKRDARGLWRAAVRLGPGRYEFKFLVDGEWCCEAGCERAHDGCLKCVQNEFGTMNRVLKVS